MNAATCDFCRNVAPGPHHTCVICGFDGHAGLGYWAFPLDEHELPPVCKGSCWRKYQASKAERDAERDLLETLERWANPVLPVYSRA